jgi:hypothetical protein
MCYGNSRTWCGQDVKRFIYDIILWPLELRRRRQPVHSRRRETLTQRHTVTSQTIPTVIRNLLGSLLQLFSNPGRRDRYAIPPYAFCANQEMEHISETPCFNVKIKSDGYHIRSFVRNRLRVGIAYKPKLLWVVWTDNIETHCCNESKSLGMLVNCFCTKVGLHLMRMLVGIGRHC